MDRLERADHLIDPVAGARLLGPAIAAASDEIERTRRLPPALLSALHDARLFRLLLPRSVGGEEVTPGIYMESVEEVARHDASVAWNLFVGNSSALVGAYIALDIAREIWRDPHTVVSWGPPNEARARAVPGGYRITGRWDFASGCRAANWMGAHALVEEENGGALRLNSYGRPGQRILLAPASQAVLLDTWDTIGLRGTASDQFAVTDLFVPDGYSFSRDFSQPAFERREPGALYRMSAMTCYEVGFAGVALGIARGALDDFVETAKTKVPRGGKSPIRDSTVVQTNLAQAEIGVRTARAYLLQELARIWNDVSDGAALTIDHRIVIRGASTNAIHKAREAVDFAYNAAGATAIFENHPLERRFRDIHTVTQQLQGRLSHFETVGAWMMGADADLTFV